MVIITIISIVIYVIAILMISTNIYEFEKDKKIKFILLGIVITFILTIFICQISSNGIQANINHINIAKKTGILLFAPINAILFLPYMGNLLNKYKGNRINSEQLRRKMILLLIILIVVTIFETGYIKDFEIGLIKNAIKS